MVLVPRILLRVARTGNMELFLLVAVVIALGTAALTAHLGLSLALGAFLGGLLISDSEFAHEALARILPIRDVFVAMFFVMMPGREPGLRTLHRLFTPMDVEWSLR